MGPPVTSRPYRRGRADPAQAPEGRHGGRVADELVDRAHLSVGVLPDLLDAFRTGAGVPYPAYGDDAVDAQAALNRPAFTHQLAGEWLPAIPDLHARLSDSARPARVADVGCGLGWASTNWRKPSHT